ncbi:hypothetical protein [Aquibaculum arenosum]|uniref:Uncharacterized protein n=1 Tax=Aquibaculum arenosum TaxID=3032591 RepID=A0ABT5YNW3_9PROT|nr:hypothetical protein [Fodinicurvata sp. CAU 1616]MDF2096491.1 hypothetical protein [Fodinicurvata sp. CAU 1616]
MKRWRGHDGSGRVGRGQDALELQRRHSPTERVDILLDRWLDVVSETTVVREERQSVERRVLDARLWGSLGAGQQRAAVRLEAGFSILTRGIGMQASAIGRPRLDGTPQEPDYPQELVEDYLRWSRACRQDGLDHDMVMDVLGQGYSCAETDRRRRQRKGRAAQGLRDALSLFCRLRGWPPE